MPKLFNLDVITSFRQQLYDHPIYHSVKTLDDLQLFMSHHVYSVWDFMSLVKTLQAAVAPARVPWVPAGNPAVRHFINSIVLEEESDEALPGKDGQPAFTSHFELYCQAMKDIGAHPGGVLQFIEIVKSAGIHKALAFDAIPVPSRRFMAMTFDVIESDKLHKVAASLAFGREHIIPDMFRKLLADVGISKRRAEAFHYYLERHIHLDEGFHGPQSVQLLEEVCDNDPVKLEEAETTACEAIQARILFWDGVLEAINSK